jgi:hypothetical protein
MSYVQLVCTSRRGLVELRELKPRITFTTAASRAAGARRKGAAGAAYATIFSSELISPK